MIVTSTLTSGRPLFGKEAQPDESRMLLKQEMIIGEESKLPALWAMPKFEFDEALGILVVGNIYGELGICDYVGQPMSDIHIAEDFSTHRASDLGPYPKVRPIALY